MTQVAKKIVIVGGGTAGWMAANLMAKSWSDQAIEITLLESKDIGIIGVGEGSTPQLKGFMDFLGVKEADWMERCNATYKNGITFAGWSSKPGFSSYFHPFPAQPDDYSAPAFFHNSFIRRKGIDVNGHPDDFFLATYLAKHKLAPIADYHFPFEINYGYHFDSHLLGQFLGEHAKNLGVKHIQTTIVDVKNHLNGDIAAVVDDKGMEYSGDIFLDCTGFKGLLIQENLKVPFESFGQNLFNDAAVVLPTDQTHELASETVSTALSNGWAWKIPLTNRNGNGYVYSRQYCDADQAETELRAHLGLLDSDVQARHLSMKVGQVNKHWHKNCVAVGLSQGFIEPLEATALHIVQETIQGFIDHYQAGQFSNQKQNDFNRDIYMRYQAIRDYIVAHYRVNSRNDSQYWLDNANNNYLSPSLVAILQTWMKGENLTDELARQKIDNYYPSVSWHCLLAGYGIYPEQHQLIKGNEFANKYDVGTIKNYIERCGLNFKAHRDILEKLGH